MRAILLQLSRNEWLKEHVPQWKFVRRAVRRFMPGETVDDALDAAARYQQQGIHAVITRLGENVAGIEQAEQTRDHYLDAVDKIVERGLDVEISLKLTHLGLDLSEDAAYQYCEDIANKVLHKTGSDLFIDMESGEYVQRTIDVYTWLKEINDNVGLCIQSYLHRTDDDLDHLFSLHAPLRLVKGAYRESASVAVTSKKKVDEMFFDQAQCMLERTKHYGTRMVYATHDEKLIARIIDEARKIGLPEKQVEFQMLYGVKTSLQKQLADEGYTVKVLISYGESWYPWYMRRLAERPANLMFVLKNVVFRN